MQKTLLTAALIAAFVTSSVLTATARAGEPAPTPIELTGIEDFDMAVVFRPLFPGFADRNAITTQARWQVNGDQTGTTGTLGIFAVFDIDAASLSNGETLTAIEQIEFLIAPAVNLDTGTGGVSTAGDLSIYFTTSDVDVLDPDGGIIFDNGGGTDPTGLGDQFEGLTLLSSAFQETGIYDIERSVATIDFEGLEAELLARVAEGANIRFLIASQTPGFGANFGTGNEDSSPNFDFFGEPPVVRFSVSSEAADSIFGDRFELPELLNPQSSP